MTTIAINGFGRIGRNVLRAFFEKEDHNLEIVAINDLADIESMAHLFKYDSTHGIFNGDVKVDGQNLVVNGRKISVSNERSPSDLPWGKLNVDIVLECSGVFNSKEKASAHITAGAKKVLISAPAGDADKTIVFGVNHEAISPQDVVLSNASCTTNCLSPVAKVINDLVGIEQGIMTTIHAYTGDQRLLDADHSDMRRARSAALSMIPTSTGAAKAVGLVLPELNGKLDGFAIRVPTPNVSVVDLTFIPTKATSIAEINKAIKEAAEGSLKNVLGYNEEPLVSIDMNHNANSSIFDATQTRIMEGGKLVKILTWYDNEWGFSNRMIDTANYMGNL